MRKWHRIEQSCVEMVGQANKRRKLEHSSSSEELEEDASFASFGSSGGEDGQEPAGFETAITTPRANDDEHHYEALADRDGAQDTDEEEGTLDTDQEGVQETAPMSDQRAARPSKEHALKAAKNGYASGSSQSNVFKLQMDELLDQIRPRQTTKESEAEAALRQLKTTIDQIPPRAPQSIEEAEQQLRVNSGVTVPFPDPRPPKDAKYKLEYKKPANINVVGSYALKTASRANRTMDIDMVVMMPAPMFQEKDYLNYRYFYKRAYYLACIAAGLRESLSEGLGLHFRDLGDNPLTPVLVVTSPPPKLEGNKQKQERRWQINIIPSIPADLFSHDKLLPGRNCVRSQDATAPTTREQSPTPFYNSSIRSDMLMISYLKLLHRAPSTCGAFQDACLLGNTWLRQRGLESNIRAGGFGNFEWSALMAVLLQNAEPGRRAILSEGYSSYQLFKATLQLLAMRDMSKQPLIVGPDQSALRLLSSSSPIVWDGTRGHNLLYKMTPWSYKLLRQEARTTLSTFSDQNFDGFDTTFILRTDEPLYRYDYVVTVDAISVGGGNVVGDHSALAAYQNLYDDLQRGLGDRVHQINIMPPLNESRGIGAFRHTATERNLMVGLMVNPNTVGRTVDHGPTAEQKAEATSFRAFWADKAELRRFKDGSVHETVIWSGNDCKQSPLEQILRYLMKTHFGDEAEQKTNVLGNGFQSMLPQGSGLAAFQPLMESYKQLETDIRALDGLPLSIRQIMPADAQLRYSSWPAQLNGHQSMPADITLQFEGSARWPDDLVAIQRTKLAFLLKLGEVLQTSDNHGSARIGLENEEHDILNQAFLDIAYDSGSAFRLRIHHDREQTLLERKVKDKAADPRSKELAALGLARYKRDYLKTPAHTQAITQLCSRFPALSGTIRLAKKWFASHLLCNHIAEEVVELLVARTFVQPWPWQAPSSVQTGFLRTLFWISRWDWRAEPLIVDLSGNNSLKQPDVHTINSNFEAWRRLDPALNRIVLFAASNVDPDGTTWTDGQSAKVVTSRMTALAKAACAEIEADRLQLKPASLFASSLGDFDFVIHLNPYAIGTRPKRKQTQTNGTLFKNLELDTYGDVSLVGCDRVADLTHEFELVYGSAILFFSGGHERPVIAGLWQPQTATREWRLNLAYSTMPDKLPDSEAFRAQINKGAILAEIAHLGGAMIEAVEVNSP